MKELKRISLSAIAVDPDQPRKNKPADYIRELGNSIAAAGLDNPIQVRETEPGRFMVISGECRFLAHCMNDTLNAIGEIDAFVVSGLSEKDVFLKQITENVARLNMTESETIKAFARAENLGCTVAEMASMTGKSEGYVRENLKLSVLNPEMLTALDDGKIFKATATALAELSNDSWRAEAFKKACKKTKSGDQVAAIRAYMADLNGEKMDKVLGLGEAPAVDQMKKAAKLAGKFMSLMEEIEKSGVGTGLMIKAARKQRGQFVEACENAAKFSAKAMNDYKLFKARIEQSENQEAVNG